MISRSAERLLQARVDYSEALRSARVRFLIASIRAKWGLKLRELSKAIDVYAPPYGGGGNSAVGMWWRGIERPTDRHLAMLEMLFAGELELCELQSAEGRAEGRAFRVEASGTTKGD